jgi:hypothetical protein
VKQFSKFMFLVLGFGLLAAILSSFPVHRVAAAVEPPAINVDVVNTPSVNAHVTNTSLPVTGSVNAAVTGTVNAAQSGAWNVGISGTPSVNANITNAALDVSGTLTATIAPGTSVSVTNQPGTTHLGQDVNNLVTLWAGYSASGSGYPTSTCAGFQQVLPKGTLSPTQCFAVPAGMFLVITDVQFTTNCSGTPVGDVSLTLDGGYHYFAAKQYDSNGWVAFHDYLTTGIVFDHSPAPYVVDSTGTVFFSVTLQGYLIPST